MHSPLGIHHLTAVAGDPVRNWHFYTRVLGERMVKKTVNFDDPHTYHLYYGDAAGSPGTLITFFPWRNLPRRPTGNRQVTAASYAVPAGSLAFWSDRLREMDVPATPLTRFGAPGLCLADPDGLPVELLATDDLRDLPHWTESPVPAAHRLRGFHSATITVPRAEPSLRLLTDVFGLTVRETEGARTRLTFPSRAPLDVVEDPDLSDHGLGAGIMHHIAFRAADRAHEAELMRAVREAGLQTTDPIDRDYFLSVYFREPGGVLYEIATDPPGFTVDEPADALGTSLRLPKQHEHLRAELERDLPAVPPASE